MYRVLMAFIMGAISFGCNEEGTLGSSNPDLYEVSFITLDKFGQEETSFSQGEEITLSLSIKNISSGNTEIRFNSGCQVSYKVLDKSGEEIQNNLSSVLCTLAFSSFMLAPGETKTHQAVWDQKQYQDYLETKNYVSSGDYSIKAYDFGVDLEVIRKVRIL